MTLHVRPRREVAPRLWTFFCSEWLVLPSPTTKHWWGALQRARWSRPVALRTVFLCRAALGSRQGAVRHFVTQNVTPQTLIHALEDLIQERLLAPREARQIEEAVLAKTHVSGLWV